MSQAETGRSVKYRLTDPGVYKRRRIIVVGAGRQRAAIEECIRESLKNAAAQGWIAPGDRPPIILAGYRDDVPHVMAALDVVVIPSHMEARCRVIAEAFAMRRPVIATQVGGIPEIVKHGVNGVLVPAKSPIKLADTIAHLLSDNALRAQLAMAAWVTAKTDLSLDKVMAQTLDLYERLI